MRTQLYNIPWLNANATRNYPLEDCAGKIDDTGASLPDDILADMNIWYPDGLGTTAFVSSVMVSPNLVSLTICAYDVRACQANGASSQFIPLAAITLPRPIDVYRNYKLTGYQQGVGGWVIFGPGINSTYTRSYRFSNPTQSAILPHLVKTYPTGIGVTTLGKPGYATKLTGLIKFLSDDAQVLKIEKDQIRVDGDVKDAVVFRLNQEESGPSIFEKFLGPCDGRPESNTCRGTPIHNINNITPYCDGTIKVYMTELTLDGHTDMVLSYGQIGSRPLNTGEGDTIAMDYNIGMDNVCEPKSSSIRNDKLDHCDDPCDDWAAKGEGASPLPNICFVWYTGRVAEPGEAFNGKDPTFIRYSNEFTIDVTGLASTTPLFTMTGASDDILMIMSSSETIDTSVVGGTVYVDIPPTAIMIRDNAGCLIASECDDGVSAHGPTCAKLLRNKSNTAQTYFLPSGTVLANCRGSTHVDDIVGLPNPKLSFNHTFLLSDFPSAWIDGSNILRIKCAHMGAGWGFASVEFQCGSL
jgi:hypothetical protein